MSEFVSGEVDLCCSPIIAFVARVWTLAARMHTLMYGASRGHRGELPAFSIGLYFIDPTLEVHLLRHSLLERCMDGAYNHIPMRPQVASKFSLERLPNAARRQFVACADSGANEPCHRDAESFG